MGKLADEIHSKPFQLPEEEAMLSVVRTADLLMQRSNSFLKRFDLSAPQYNVLRILRGSPCGLSCTQISERMITHDSDITRLLDRLEARGLVSRQRNLQDRRVVVARITESCLQLLAAIDPDMAEQHRRTLGRLGEGKLHQLIGLLEQARDFIDSEKETNESDISD